MTTVLVKKKLDLDTSTSGSNSRQAGRQNICRYILKFVKFPGGETTWILTFLMSVEVLKVHFNGFFQIKHIVRLVFRYIKFSCHVFSYRSLLLSTNTLNDSPICEKEYGYTD